MISETRLCGRWASYVPSEERKTQRPRACRLRPSGSGDAHDRVDLGAWRSTATRADAGAAHHVWMDGFRLAALLSCEGAGLGWLEGPEWVKGLGWILGLGWVKGLG